MNIAKVSSKNLNRFILAGLIECAAAAAVLFLIPSDARGSLWLGFSLERWLMIGCVLLLAAVLGGLVALQRSARGKELVSRMLESKWMLVLFLLALFAVFMVVLYWGNEPARLIRLSPVLISGCLICLQVLLYQRASSSQPGAYLDSALEWLDKKNALFWLVLLAAIPLLFTDAVRNIYPMGFAGLYTQMAEDIAAAGFRLPMDTPFYGPGGIPFAYPPLGFYLMAVFLKMGVSAWTYLRFAPAFFSLLSLVPVYALARRVLGSKFGGSVVMLLAAGSPILFLLQTGSGGVVRGLAFGLGMTAVYFLDRLVTSFRWRDAIIAGVFFGLTFLTHIGYAFYFAFWFFAWVITNPKNGKIWIGAVIAAVTGLITALPWIITMLVRYGMGIFTTVSQSHGSYSIINLVRDPGAMLPVLWASLQCLVHAPLLLVLILLGLGVLLAHKKATLPLLLFLSIIINQGERSIMLAGYFIAGYAVCAGYQWLSGRFSFAQKPSTKILSLVIIAAAAIPLYFAWFEGITRQTPLIDQAMLDAAAYLRDNTPAESTYLSLFTNDSQEDEWFPYLARRAPVMGVWGSEWLGTLDFQYGQLAALGECTGTQDLVCLESMLAANNLDPDYLLMVSNLEGLAASLEQSAAWENVYANDGYVIWVHQ